MQHMGQILHNSLQVVGCQQSTALQQVATVMAEQQQRAQDTIAAMHTQNFNGMLQMMQLQHQQQQQVPQAKPAPPQYPPPPPRVRPPSTDDDKDMCICDKQIALFTQ